MPFSLDAIPALLDQLATIASAFTTPAGAVVTALLAATAYGLRAYLKSKAAAPAKVVPVIATVTALVKAEKAPTDNK